MNSQQGHKPYSVRVLTAKEIGLFRQLMSTFSDAFEDPQHYLSCPPEDSYLQSLLAGELFVAMVAFSEPDGSVVGGLTGYVLPKFEQARSEFYLYDLAVRESCRRRGIASALIRHLQVEMRRRGVSGIFVQADVEDIAAVELYSKFNPGSDVLQFEIPVASP